MSFVIILKVVVFPAPFIPNKPNISPYFTPNVILFTAFFLLNVFFNLLT